MRELDPIAVVCLATGAHGFHTATLAAQQPKLTCDNCGEKVGGAAQQHQQHTPGCGVSFQAAAK